MVVGIGNREDQFVLETIGLFSFLEEEEEDNCKCRKISPPL